jgi:hypothetical protein
MDITSGGWRYQAKLLAAAPNAAVAKGSTLAEIMKATSWQANSVRGFFPTAAKKHGLKIDSAKNEASDRVYPDQEIAFTGFLPTPPSARVATFL